MCSPCEKNMLTREKAIMRTGAVGIGVNVALSALKAIFGFIAGSVAIIMDAVNNLTDALSSVITILGVKLAKKKPDAKHPYGHGRVEYFSAMIVAVIVITAGVSALVEAIKSMIKPALPAYSVYTFVMIALAVSAKIVLSFYVKKMGKKYNSDALIASGKDAGFDAILSSSTILAGIVAIAAKISIEGYVGAIISLFILKAGIEMLFSSASDVLGKRANSETARAIKECVGEIDGVLGVYDLLIHNYGPESAIASVHVEVPSTLSANEIHIITRTAQEKVFEKFHIFLTVGIYSIDQSYASEIKRINEAACKRDGVLGTHGFYINEEKKTVFLDVVIDFTVKDKNALISALNEDFSEILPGFSFLINFDANYTD